MKAAIVITALWCVIVGGWILAVEINHWEKANAFPYGKMCQSVFTGWQNTCR